MVVFISEDDSETMDQVWKFCRHALNQTVIVNVNFDDLPISKVGPEGFWENRLKVGKKRRIHRSFKVFRIWLSKLWFTWQVIELDFFDAYFICTVTSAVFETRETTTSESWRIRSNFPPVTCSGWRIRCRILPHVHFGTIRRGVTTTRPDREPRGAGTLRTCFTGNFLKPSIFLSPRTFSSGKTNASFKPRAIWTMFVCTLIPVRSRIIIIFDFVPCCARAKKTSGGQLCLTISQKLSDQSVATISVDNLCTLLDSSPVVLF